MEHINFRHFRHFRHLSENPSRYSEANWLFQLVWFPDKRDLRFAPTGLSGLGIKRYSCLSGHYPNVLLTFCPTFISGLQLRQFLVYLLLKPLQTFVSEEFAVYKNCWSSTHAG